MPVEIKNELDLLLLFYFLNFIFNGKDLRMLCRVSLLPGTIQVIATKVAAVITQRYAI